MLTSPGMSSGADEQPSEQQGETTPERHFKGGSKRKIKDDSKCYHVKGQTARRTETWEWGAFYRDATRDEESQEQLQGRPPAEDGACGVHGCGVHGCAVGEKSVTLCQWLWIRNSGRREL